MRYADYECSFCGQAHTEFVEGDAGFPEVVRVECADCSSDHGAKIVSTFKRKWSAPAIGMVPGAGGSPSRRAGR